MDDRRRGLNRLSDRHEPVTTTQESIPFIFHAVVAITHRNSKTPRPGSGVKK
jgi:hypothetical protein